MYLISVYFDDKTDRRIRNWMKQVAKRSGNSYMIDAKVPPHITISAFETRRETEAAEMLKCAAEDMKSGTVMWASAGAFFPGVIYLAPVLNAYLQGLSVKIYEGLTGIEETRISPMYRPFQWMPHTTIAKKLEKEEMMAVFRVMQEQFGVFSGDIVKIALARTNPYEDLICVELNK